MCDHSDTERLRLQSGEVVAVDECLAPLLQALNDAGIPTSESCCGHGKAPSQIFFQPGPPPFRLVVFACCGAPFSVSVQWNPNQQDAFGRVAFD